METIVGGASLLKRPKLRAATLTLISDLYNKHFELLERHGVIDRVEQCYYRLRK
jgi:hypothetical protein